MVSVGEVVSTKYWGLLTMVMELVVALLPDASSSVELFKLRALAAMATPSESVWPLAMEAVKTKALEPEPET